MSKNPALLWRCVRCGSGCEPGKTSCSDRCSTLVEQTNAKCREFGMQPYYVESRPFPFHAAGP